MAFQPSSPQYASGTYKNASFFRSGLRWSSRALRGALGISRSAYYGIAPRRQRTFPGVLASAFGNGKGDVQAVCLGEGLFDLLADQYDVPREGVKSWTPYAGGAPCNVSAALAKLGVSVAFVSAVGKDDMGEDLMRILQGTGVDLDAVQRTQEPTRDVYVTRKSNGEREFSGFGLPANQYCDCFLNVDELPVERIQAAEVLITGTLGLAYPATSRAMKRAVKKALGAKTLVMVDVNWRPVFFSDTGDATREEIAEYVKLADIVKLTDEECEWLFGLDADTAIQNPCKVQKHLPNAKGVLVTGGEKGAGYCFSSGDTEMSGYIPVFDVNVVDTTGAGDAFTAGFVHQLLQAGGLGPLTATADSLESAVRFASACGGLTTTRPGAIEGQPALDSIINLAATKVA